MDNKLYYPHTDDAGVDTMSESRFRKQVQLSLSENQLAAIDKAAAEMGLNRSEYVRWVMGQVIPQFPDDLPAQGENLKKKAS